MLQDSGERPRLSSIGRDRKSTRLNSSHEWSSYAVFCLKKKNENQESKRKPPFEKAEWRPSWPVRTTPHEQCNSRKLEHIPKRVKFRGVFQGFTDVSFLD